MKVMAFLSHTRIPQAWPSLLLQCLKCLHNPAQVQTPGQGQMFQVRDSYTF